MTFKIYEFKPNAQRDYWQRGSVMTNHKVGGNVVAFRTGERGPRVSFRAQRLFTIGHDWYFSTREGYDMGPFISKGIAELAIENYLLKRLK